MASPAYVVGLPSRDIIQIPGVIAVCERDDGTIWLVDAGWSAEVCANPKSLGRLRRLSLGVRLQRGDDMASQLRAAGLDPARVTAVVATHLHLDHVGGVADFPNAELIATHNEVAAAYRASWIDAYRKQDIERVERLRLVRLRDEPRLGFPRSASIDDDVVLLDTHGHTAGHTAVLLREGSKTWIHAGDAAYRRGELSMHLLAPLSRMMAHDPTAARDAQRRLRACEADASRPTLVFSHDAPGFATLPQLGTAT
ncbi:MAG: MBL fold metallo-hydrolase [Polyangiaceae bacterium]|jgi:glyoxylase-like metal-dependent hydrolase (beta-lactamase superfamily II)|nr:MBL fold metallo-hydrolase [Polyangiaceae bacterium]